MKKILVLLITMVCLLALQVECFASEIVSNEHLVTQSDLNIDPPEREWEN